MRARELWDVGTQLVTSRITFAEVSAAIAAARRSRRLTRPTTVRLLEQLELEWSAVDALDVDERATRAAGSLAVKHGLRGMDAIHLASALTLAAVRPIVVTWDAELRRASLAEGLAVSV